VLVTEIVNHADTVVVAEDSVGFCYSKKDGKTPCCRPGDICVTWCPTKDYYGSAGKGDRDTTGAYKHAPCVMLAHELIHALQQLRGNNKWSDDIRGGIVRGENEIRFELGMPFRPCFQGSRILDYFVGGTVVQHSSCPCTLTGVVQRLKTAVSRGGPLKLVPCDELE
jgi:hypothetical protein